MLIESLNNKKNKKVEEENEDEEKLETIVTNNDDLSNKSYNNDQDELADEIKDEYASSLDEEQKILKQFEDDENGKFF